MFGTTTNRTTDKPVGVLTLLANYYVYKCKLQGSMPVLTVFQTISWYGFDIETYPSFMPEKKYFDFKMQSPSYTTWSNQP